MESVYCPYSIPLESLDEGEHNVPRTLRPTPYLPSLPEPQLSSFEDSADDSEDLDELVDFYGASAADLWSALLVAGVECEPSVLFAHDLFNLNLTVTSVLNILETFQSSDFVQLVVLFLLETHYAAAPLKLQDIYARILQFVGAASPELSVKLQWLRRQGIHKAPAERLAQEYSCKLYRLHLKVGGLTAAEFN